jgi:hypothetical protein
MIERDHHNNLATWLEAVYLAGKSIRPTATGPVAAKPQPETRCTTCDVQRELRHAREALEMAELEIEAMRKRVDALLAENGERLL